MPAMLDAGVTEVTPCLLEVHSVVKPAATRLQFRQIEEWGRATRI